MAEYIIVLDHNLNDPSPWQASAIARSLEEIQRFRTHDCTCTHVPRRNGDRTIAPITLFGSCTNRNDTGIIIRTA